MAVEVYLDVIFLENLVVNYLILLITGKLLRTKPSNARLFLGAFLGAAYVVPLVLFPQMRVYQALISKMLLSLAIVAVAFSPENLRGFAKALAFFYITTFVFAGAAFAFIYLSQNKGFIANGIIYVYWQSTWTMLFWSILTVAIIIRICWELMQKKLSRENLLVKLIIAFENKYIDVDALIDTGNSLHDPLTDMPVVIVEFRALKDILPEEIRSIFESSKENNLPEVTDIIAKSKWYTRFRLIPFASLGVENGMLIGFRPDYVEVIEKNNSKSACDAIIGIYNKALSKNEKYRALLNPELI